MDIIKWFSFQHIFTLSTFKQCANVNSKTSQNFKGHAVEESIYWGHFWFGVP